MDDLNFAAPADERDVARLRSDYGRQVPDDYLAFLARHDGAEGAAGHLDPAAEVGRGIEVCPDLDHLRDLVIFGGDDGLEAFAFDAEGRAVVVPWIGGLEDAIPQGTFTEFLDRLLEDRLFDRDL